MVGDVDQQVLFNEALNSSIMCDRRDNLQSCSRDVDICDKDAGMEVIGGEMLREVSHLFDTD